MYTGEELLEMWLDSGISQRRLAEKIGMNFDIMHGRIFRAQKAEEKLTETSERIEMVSIDNVRVYTAKGHKIKTLEDLIRVGEIDLEGWRIDRYVENAWEVTTREGMTYTNFQVKAWLTNKYPEPIMPVISNVEINIEPIKTSIYKGTTSGRTLVLADPHFGFRKDVDTGELTPFHDRYALTIALAMIAELKPERILLLGDWLDLAEVSDKFIRSPDMFNTTQPALVEAAWFLGQIRKVAPKARIYLLEGNHEGRLIRAINKQIPYAFGITQPVTGLPILSVENMLGLAKLGIEYIGDYPNGEIWLGDRVRAIHGDIVRAKSGATATAILDNSTATTLYAHVHRIELAAKTVFGPEGPRIIYAFTSGCLCRIDGVVPAVRGKMNWQKGIGVVDFDGDLLALWPVPITNDLALFEGKRYQGYDYINELIEDTGYKF